MPLKTYSEQFKRDTAALYESANSNVPMPA